MIYERKYPATINTPSEANLVADLATEMFWQSIALCVT